MNEVAAVIVNWNGEKYLKDCFDSLKNQTYKNFKIIFVDNGSRDDSVNFIKNNYLEAGFPSIVIIELNKNAGFCYGYNIGIKEALKDEKIGYVAVLNNDTKLHKEFIENMVSCTGRHAEIGAVQPMVLNFNNPKEIDCTGIVFARDGTTLNRGYGMEDEEKYTEEEIFGANGTAGLFTREALEKIKYSDNEYFDNCYFAYYEDVDLAWRMRLAGFKAYFCPKAITYHIHSATAGKSSLLKAYYLHRNYFFTVFKNYPADIMLKTLAHRFFSYIRLVFNLFRKEKSEEKSVATHGKGRAGLVILKAWGSVIYNLPGIIAHRRQIKKIKNVSKGEIELWLKMYQADQ